MASPSNIPGSLGRWSKSFVSRQRDNLLRPADHDGWVWSLIWSAFLLAIIVPLLLWANAPYLAAGLSVFMVAELSATAAEQLPGHKHRTTVILRIAALAFIPLVLVFVGVALVSSGDFTGLGLWLALLAYGFSAVYFPLRSVLGYDARAKRERTLTEPSRGPASGIDYARRGGSPQPYEPHRPHDRGSRH